MMPSSVHEPDATAVTKLYPSLMPDRILFPIDLIISETLRRKAVEKGYLPRPLLPKFKLTPLDLIELQLKQQDQSIHKLNASKEELSI
jgi:hypothetical protein